MPMKILILALFLSINSFAANYNYLVDNYKKIPGMDFQLELLTRHPMENQRILVDCQSFINGIHFAKKNEGRWSDIWYIIISGNECEEVRAFVFETINNSAPFCLQVDVETRNINFNSSLEECL